jgi:CRISPR/Cas system CMR-associated protein Cmr3 (group 5 of RAMP superfamily)
MTELNIRMEVGYPTDDTIELEGEGPVVVRLLPLYFYRNDEGEPLLIVQINVERKEDEDGLVEIRPINTLEQMDYASGIDMKPADSKSPIVKFPQGMSKETWRYIRQFRKENRDVFLMLEDLLDYARTAIKKQLLKPGAVIRHSDLPENTDDEFED